MAEFAEPSEQVDRLRLDYQQTTSLLSELSDVRFKLLALVPTLSGAAVAVLSRPSSTAELLAVGLIGLLATVGVLLYELRNTQLYDYGLKRAQLLERELGLFSTDSGAAAGRPVLRPPRQDPAPLRPPAGRPRRRPEPGLQRCDRRLDVSVRLGERCTRSISLMRGRSAGQPASSPDWSCSRAHPGPSSERSVEALSDRDPRSWASRSASARTAAPAAGRSSPCVVVAAPSSAREPRPTSRPRRRRSPGISVYALSFDATRSFVAAFESSQRSGSFLWRSPTIS